MPRRVLHVIPAVAARYGGPSAVVLATCRALQTAGVSTLVAATDADGAARLDVQYERPQLFDGVSVIFFRRHFGEGFKWSRGIGRWLRDHVGEFDLVDIHAIFSHSSLAAGRACRRRGIPYVVRPHGMLDPWSLTQKSLRKRMLFHAGVEHLLARAAAVQYTTAEERRLAEERFRWLPTGAVVPLGVDAALFERGRPPSANPAPYVLTLSRLDAKKSLDLLIQAFHAAAQDPALAAWRLVIAGDGERAYVAQLRRLAESGPARARISFPGWVQGDAKIALLRGASLFAAPSHQENFGLSVVEAMASGVPVLVAPGLNLAAEIEGAGAGWVVPHEAAAVRDALRAAAADPEELERRRGAAEQFADRFRWSAAADRLIELYDQVLDAAIPFGARLESSRTRA